MFVAAPAIVRAASIMPVKAIDVAEFEWSPFYTAYPVGSLYGELTEMTRAAFVPRLFQQIYFASPILQALDLPQDIT